MRNKENLLFLVLGGFFVTNALVAEFIGVKIFSLEGSLGFEPILMNFFGQEDLSFNLTAEDGLYMVDYVIHHMKANGKLSIVIVVTFPAGRNRNHKAPSHPGILRFGEHDRC